MGKIKVQIEEIRAKNIKYTGQDKIDITPKNTTNAKTVIQNVPIDTTCTPIYASAGPFLSTTWDQNDGYNNFLPSMTCAANGHVLTGCWTTAIAQIFRYNEYPNYWTFSSMPNKVTPANISTSGAIEIRNLMNYIFNNSVSFPSSDVKCNSTFTLNSKGIGLLDNFYPSAVRLNYSGTSNYNLVESELNNGHPVIFTGKNSSGSLGHCFISDGYTSYEICDEVGNGKTGYLFLHMNWGYGDNYDGWYGFSNFVEPTGQFNYNYDVDVYVYLYNIF